MQLKHVSLVVQDQQKALEFYTSVLGFKKIVDVPAGEHRWLCVAAPGGIEGVELVLEPAAFPPANAYQAALFEADIPALLLVTEDIEAEHGRLSAKGVKFRRSPTEAGSVKLAIFEDTCGNLVQMIQFSRQAGQQWEAWKN